MAAPFLIKRNDTLPALEAILSDDSGPVSLAGTTVQFTMRPAADKCRSGENAALFLKSVIVVGSQDVGSPTRGKVRYEWAASDTAEEGNFLGEFKVQFGVSGKWTFPTVGAINIKIDPDIS